MAGAGVVLLREGLASLVNVLDEQDFVTITRFGTTTDAVQPKPAAFDSDFRHDIFLPAVKRLEANLGGADIPSALEAVLRLPEAPGVRRIVLLMTAGEIWSQEAMDRVLPGASTPVFTIVAGEYGTEAIPRRTAEATGGLCEMVSHAKDMTHLTRRLLAAARCVPAQAAASRPFCVSPGIPTICPRARRRPFPGFDFLTTEHSHWQSQAAKAKRSPDSPAFSPRRPNTFW